MKKIFFVRHGETLANHGHIHQGPHEPLSEKGREQAVAVAETLRALGVDTLACSNYARAIETAEIIGEKLDLPSTVLESVKEFRRPDSLYGKSHYSFSSLMYVWRLQRHRVDATWDDEGAENMFHIRNRIEDAKRDISALPGNDIAIVSHAIFMDMFTQMICADRPLKITEFIRGLVLSKKTPNTGIIEFEVDELAPNGTCCWWFKGIRTPTGKLLK